MCLYTELPNAVWAADPSHIHGQYTLSTYTILCCSFGVSGPDVSKGMHQGGALRHNEHAPRWCL